MALGDDVKELAIRDGTDVRRVRKHAGARIVHFGLRAVSLPRFAVTFRAFVEVDGQDLLCGRRRLHVERVFHELGLGRENPDAAIESGKRKIGGEGEQDNEKNGDVASGGRLLFIGHPLNFHTD